MLSLLALGLLALGIAASAQDLQLTYPKYPEAGLDFYVQWSGGTPPVSEPCYPSVYYSTLLIDEHTMSPPVYCLRPQLRC